MDMQSRLQIRKNFNYDELEMTRNTLIKAQNYAAQSMRTYLLSNIMTYFLAKLKNVTSSFSSGNAYTIYRYKKYNTPELRNSQIIQISGPDRKLFY